MTNATTALKQLADKLAMGTTSEESACPIRVLLRLDRID